MTSPRLIPIRNLIRRSSGVPASRSIIARCTSAAADRVDDAREFRQHPVAGRLYDAAGMLADLHLYELAAMHLEALVRAFLIGAHQARVVRHIGGENRGETAGCGHCAPGAIMFSNEFTLKSS